MTIQEFLAHMHNVAKEKMDLGIGIGITDIEYRDRHQQLSVAFCYYEQQDIQYNLVLDGVFCFSKYNANLPNLDGKMWPEKPLVPFINSYSESRLLRELQEELGITVFFEQDLSTIRHYQLTAQNMIVNMVSKYEPIISIL